MTSTPNKHGFRSTRLDEVTVVQLVKIETAEGAGVETDPVRTVWRYFDLDGNFVAEHDTSSPPTLGGHYTTSKLRQELRDSADELVAARIALVEHGCHDDNLKNIDDAVLNARRAADPFSARPISGDSEHG